MAITVPTTKDSCINFFNKDSRLVSFDVPISCSACARCLADLVDGICPYGGPFIPRALPNVLTPL